MILALHLGREIHRPKCRIASLKAAYTLLYAAFSESFRTQKALIIGF